MALNPRHAEPFEVLLEIEKVEGITYQQMQAALSSSL